jgi:hypothetical protein
VLRKNAISGFWHPSGVRGFFQSVTGGLRIATTSGYSLTTLRVVRAIQRHPEGMTDSSRGLSGAIPPETGQTISTTLKGSQD